MAKTCPLMKAASIVSFGIDIVAEAQMSESAARIAQKWHVPRNVDCGESTCGVYNEEHSMCGLAALPALTR